MPDSYLLTFKNFTKSFEHSCTQNLQKQFIIQSNKSYFEVIDRPNIWWDFDLFKSRSLKSYVIKTGENKIKITVFLGTIEQIVGIGLNF